jgi:hypothetical protein
VTGPGRVPIEIADVTPEFLATALGERLVASAAITCERIGADHGMTSTILRCRWLDSTGPRSVVLKLWDARGPGGRQEPAFYETFGRRLGIRVPACHFGAIDDRSGRGVLVLEDLGPVSQGDALLTLDGERATATARLLADLHATWWEHPDLEASDWLPTIAPIGRGRDWFEARRRRFLERYADRIGDGEREALAAAGALAARADAVFRGAPSTLLHADLHLDNVVFDGDHPILLDWARTARGPGEVDLAELVFGVAGPSARREVVDAYLAELIVRGIDVDRDATEHRLAAGAIRHFLRSTVGSAEWEPASDREVRLIDVGIARGREALDWLATTEPGLLGT